MTKARLAGAIVVLALAGAACSSTTSATSSRQSEASGSTPVTASTDTGASALRAGLTSLLQEHVYLAGIAINTAVTTGLTSPSTKAATAALDVNTVNLSNAIDGAYAGAGKTFLPLWRKHIGFFVDYTVAGSKGDKAGQAKAKKDLDGYRSDFGAFLASANPNLTKDAVADSLIPHVSTLFDAIDSVLAKKTDVFDKLMTAADVMPKEANVLAGAIAKQFPDKFGG